MDSWLCNELLLFMLTAFPIDHSLISGQYPTWPGALLQ
jgi:hypothetical protein